MNEIPISYVRANQWGLVISILVSFLLQIPEVLLIVLVIQAVGLKYGVKYNVFVKIAKILFIKDRPSTITESAEIQRFNNSIAVGLLLLSAIFYLTGFILLSYLFALMVAFAATLAIFGFCIGCKIYYQFKRLKQR
jgi:hypothetical protein